MSKTEFLERVNVNTDETISLIVDERVGGVLLCIKESGPSEQASIWLRPGQVRQLADLLASMQFLSV